MNPIDSLAPPPVRPSRRAPAPGPVRPARRAPLPAPAPARAAPARRRAPLVAILGLGYVGLPTALAFASAGGDVLGVDVCARRLADVASGDVDLLPSDRRRLALHRDRSVRCTDDAAVLADADAVVVCVPTPVDDELRPDLRALRGACRTVLEHVRPGQLLVLTSTTSVGSTRELLLDPLRDRGLVVGEDVFVAFAPERIDPGNTAHPQESVPRVVGGATPACADRAAEVLGRIAPIHRVSSPEAAELCKLHENTFRAVNIAYAYELSRAAAAYGLDTKEVVDAAASKPFGFLPFHPSAGVGGHCIPCDPHYLLQPLRGRGGATPIIEHAMRAIADRPGTVVTRALEVLEARGVTTGARVLVLGAAYKPGVADVRESPALAIIAGLLDAGVQVGYHDPLVPTLRAGGRTLTSDPAPRAEDHDLVVLVQAQPGSAEVWAAGTTPVLDCTHAALAPGDPRRHLV
jgi:nucleotide sugar dehydrogenase